MKRNKIFVNKFDKKIGHNQSYTNINNTQEDIPTIENKDNDNQLSVEDKINRLFKRNGYIFNVDVKIITKDKEYNTKIATKIKNHLITLDNDIIDINNIQDIIIKN